LAKRKCAAAHLRYTRGDPTEKLDAMKSIVPPHLRRGAFQHAKILEKLTTWPLQNHLGWNTA
jgi:hypothetical protein